MLRRDVHQQTSSPQASGLDSFADIMSSGTSTLPGLARSRDAMQAR